ncbi:MAG: ribosome biogenesis GTPase Der [Clostridiales bacterium]|jgi:GTP-binding protein|nr:ribosome biogenesis GTPase Der [Clostridiales bacterium]HOK81209.1 ribosome biogenesis GTPase Der [Clostridia bacterium]HOL60328.1 ribosome biogenesis GTPase Der [Clostridia bacterium]HPO53085.1 ribosome biogenesis GTPase Der [Clostridia bacterium]
MVTPMVAIVGRPNVGKSTFFNKVVGRRLSIVNDTPGVTRDRLYADVEWQGRVFTLIDTGGIEVSSEDIMWKQIRRQADAAMDAADVILFFVDGKTGITIDDHEVATFLRKCGKPVICVVNKVDGRDESVKYDFYSLGLGDPVAISAELSKGLGDLLDMIVGHLPETEEGGKTESLKIAVVGKPNSGKSSLVNRILGFERVIVTDIAGTTRDAIDTPFTVGDKHYTIIDTAGIRKKSKVEEDIEYYSVVRSIAAIKRADVVLVVIDSSEGITEQDVKICGLVHEAGKPSVIVMNKWDLIEKDTNTIYQFENKIKQNLKFMDYYKSIYISALTGRRADKVLDAAEEVYANASRVVATGILNDVIGDAIAVNEPPNRLGKKLKISFCKQVAANPPTFALFVNDPTIMHFSYRRYLENTLRKAFDFSGTPIRIKLNTSEKDQI